MMKTAKTTTQFMKKSLTTLPNFKRSKTCTAVVGAMVYLGSAAIHQGVAAEPTMASATVGVMAAAARTTDPLVIAQIGELQVTVANNFLPADGQSPTQVTIVVLDRQGSPLKGEVFVTVEVSGGRVYLQGAQTDELGSGRLDADKVTSGVQIAVREGKGQFVLRGPMNPQDVLVRVTAGTVTAEGVVSFVPELRNWIAAGLIEGVIALRKTKNESAITPVRSNDGFEEQLRQWSKDFNSSSSNKGSIAARTAFFVRGTIKGSSLLTATYDSDKETRLRMLRDIRAEELYPVYGDASLKTFEARSSSKLYVRVDNGKNYVLFGDFNTGSEFSQLSSTGSVASTKQRDLGSYNRTMTGVRGHWETDTTLANVFVSRDSLRQQVEEYSGNGTSGPYSVTRNDALESSEKVELIIRDRNNPGRILDQRVLQRFVDYTFEPFAGRLLFKGPIASQDPQGNPQSVRVTYEIDQGGKSYWLVGVDAQAKLGKNLNIGASFVRDLNPQVLAVPGEFQLNTLASVNASLMLGERIRLLAEVARTINDTAAGQATGNAGRIELSAADASNNWKARAFITTTDKDFYNPNASINAGRAEAGIKVSGQVTESIGVTAELTKSKDEVSGADRKGGYLGADLKLNNQWSINAGVRKSQDNGSGLYAPLQSGTVSNLYSGSGLTASSGGLFGSGTGPSNPTLGQVPSLATQVGTPIDTTTLLIGVKGKLTDKLSVGAEYERSVAGDSANRAAAIATFQVAERTALNARYESQTGLGSYFDRSNRSNALVFGVTNSYLLSGLGAGGSGVEGQLFSEYRLRDAIGGREAQLASGMRNTFDVAQGLKALVSIERLKILSGASQQATALATGLDYTGSELWKASGRLEWRRADVTAVLPRTDSLLNTLLVARKLDRDWTLLARNYFSSTDNAAVAGSQSQNRFQLGFAYRPVDHNRFDALGKVEVKNEKNTEVAGLLTSPEDRRAVVVSLHSNWHPTRAFWISGRIAGKSVNERLDGVRDKFSAAMLSGRVIYDLTERWDVGLMASVLSGSGSQQKAFGLETGYALQQNLWLSAGYNWAGFSDRDLSGAEYTARGLYIRLRFKFDESLFAGKDKLINTSLDR